MFGTLLCLVLASSCLLNPFDVCSRNKKFKSYFEPPSIQFPAQAGQRFFLSSTATVLHTSFDEARSIGHMSSRTDPADVRSWTLQVPQVSNTEGNWDLWSSPLAYFIVGGACRACNLLPLHALCWVSEANFRGKFQRQNCAIGACFVMTLDDLGRNVLCCDHECNSAEQRAG